MSKFLQILIFSTLILTACEERSSGPMLCGGALSINCPSGAYCELGSSCGGIDKAGRCAAIKESCDLNESTVCGCDNIDYKNECIANTQGVSVRNEGPCIAKAVFK